MYKLLIMHSPTSPILSMRGRFEPSKTNLTHSAWKYFECLMIFVTKRCRDKSIQVEAKRAVPRSEVSRDSLSKQQQQQGGPVSGNSSPSLRSLSNSWSNGPSTPGTPGSPSVTGVNLTMSQIQCESRQACDPRISMDEYAYNKIFVGGLHYDTRDGTYRQPVQPIQLHTLCWSTSVCSFIFLQHAMSILLLLFSLRYRYLLCNLS